MQVYRGKAIVNSFAGEGKSLKAVLPLVKEYGAAVIGLTLDEKGIPKEAEKRGEIAAKIIQRPGSFGITAQDRGCDH